MHEGGVFDLSPSFSPLPFRSLKKYIFLLFYFFLSLFFLFFLFYFYFIFLLFFWGKFFFDLSLVAGFILLIHFLFSC